MDALRQAPLPLLLEARQAVLRRRLDRGSRQAQRQVLRQVPHEQRHPLQEGRFEQVTLQVRLKTSMGCDPKRLVRVAS